MKTIILVCALCLHLGESYGSDDTDGVGAFAYDGPSGRYPFGGNLPGFEGFGGQGFQGQGFQGQGFQAHGFQGQGFPEFDMSNYGRSQNRAYAGAAIGPDFTHQVADINPANPNNPNINKYSNIGGQPGGFQSVSSSSFAMSSNVNGKKTESRGAETTVNNNGVVTSYKTKS